jgi:sulfotransferase
MRKLVFLCGLPRSGTTLLANILAQNPVAYATATSGLLDTLRAIRDVCDSNTFYKAMDPGERKERKLALLRGAIQGYFAHAEGKVCFDKSRGWPTSFEMMGWVLGGREHVKAIVCVRDIRDVLASFEKLYRVTAESSSTSQERAAFVEHRTALGRAQFIMKPDEPVGYAMDVVQDAVTRGWRDNMLFVDYDALCHSSQGTLDKIYTFIGEESFEHDPKHVEQVTREDDSVHSFVGLHDIRPEVKPQEPQWPLVYDGTMTGTPFWARVTESARYWEHMK